MPRVRDIAKQREQLSAATWSVLTERGPSGLTLRAVAERAGCTTGLVLHAFPNKQALLLHARHLLHVRANMRADAIEAAGGKPKEVLRATLETMLATTDEARDEARVWVGFLAECLGDSELRRVHVQGNRIFLDRVTRLIRVCDPGKEAVSASVASAHLLAIVEGLNALSTADPQTYHPELLRAALDDALHAVQC